MGERIRILAMLHAYPPAHCAGAEVTAHALLRRLAARGCWVDVLLSWKAGDPYELDGVRVHPFQGQGDPFAWFGTDGQSDVVVTHLENTLRAGVLCQMHKVPIVHLIHNNHDPGKWAVRRGPADLVTYNADWIRVDFEQWLQVQDEPIPNSVTVHPPVVASEYVTSPGDAVTLVNLWDDKGGTLFWQLAERMPDVQFLGVKGAYGEQESGDLPNVEVLGHMPGVDMVKLVYARTKIVLMPSRYESYGRVGVEAACSGIPTIAHPTPGLREALGGAGVFVDRGDIEGWVKAIRKLLAPRGWSAASKRAKSLAAEQDPEGDMDRWCDAVEVLARR